MPDAEPVRQSLFNSVISALGFPYVILLPLAGLVCFLLALIVVLRGKGPMSGPALILIVHIPFLIGIFAAIQGTIASYIIIATSASTPKPSELAEGISTALFAPTVGMLLMVPSYATAAIGAFIRCLGGNSDGIKPED